MGKKMNDAKDLLRFYGNVQKHAGKITSKKWRFFVFALALLVFYSVWEYQVMKFSPQQTCSIIIGDVCFAHSPDVSRAAICQNVCIEGTTEDPEHICGPTNLFYWFLVGVASGMVILIIMVEGELMMDLWGMMKIFKEEDAKIEKTIKKGKK